MLPLLYFRVREIRTFAFAGILHWQNQIEHAASHNYSSFPPFLHLIHFDVDFSFPFLFLARLCCAVLGC